MFACFLGGGTAKWAEGIVVAILGAFLIIQPPRRSLGWGINAVFAVLSLCALASFLRHRWFFIPEWRMALTNDFSIRLPDSVTPQPWLTAGCFISLMAGLCWLYRVSAQQLELRVARFQLQLFAFGVVVIAGLSILFYLTHNPPLWWQNDRGFGPFPDRNQTADLFGVTSVLILIATSADLLLPTIRSRCQTIAFQPLSAAQVRNLLLRDGHTLDEREAALAAGLCGGSLDAARQLLDPQLRALREELYNMLSAEPFLSVQTAERMIEGLEPAGSEKSSQREYAGWIIRFCVEFFRRALLAIAGGPAGDAAEIPQVRTFGVRVAASPAVVERCLAAEGQLSSNVAIPLCLEALFDDLGRTMRSA